MSDRISLSVVQHTAAEYLGLLEDHLEGRRISFRYFRPFTAGGGLPQVDAVGDGLILLGGGPWGSAGPHNLPTLVAEVELAAACLARDIPVLGFDLGAQILALAGGGRTCPAALEFRVAEVVPVAPVVLNGYLPTPFTLVRYGRDAFEPPAAARVLARDEAARPAVFQLGDNAFGFNGHPGFKAAMAEDLIMAFEESPPDAASTLAAVRGLARVIEDDLVQVMTGLIQLTGWMEHAHTGGD